MPSTENTGGRNAVEHTARPGGLMLLDSASLYFRSFFGVPSSVRAPDGTPVNAVRGFLDSISTLVLARRPVRLVACWDEDWRPAFRVAAIPSYKAHRVADPATDSEEVPDDLTVQVPVIVEMLAAFGIARAGAPGFEADDVIGTLVARERGRAAARATGIDVVTGDRDLFQLVDDAAGVRVLYTAKGLRNLEVVDEARLRARYGVDGGRAYAHLAVLRGDPSDGLPGVPGIGEKTAAGLLARFGTLEALLAARDSDDPALPPLQRRRLLDAAQYLAVAPVVVDVALDAPVPELSDDLPHTPADPDRVLELAQRWGLTGAATRLVNVLADLP